MLTLRHDSIIASPVTEKSRKKKLCLCILAAISAAPQCLLAAPEPSPGQVEFNAGFFSSASVVDISHFEHGNAMPVGDQRVDLYVNEYRISRESVEFVDAGNGSSKPCFDRALLTQMNINTEMLEAQGQGLEDACLDLNALIPDAVIEADASNLTLNVSVPQVAMRLEPRGYVDPSLWEQGMNAFTLGYALSLTEADRASANSRLSGYVGVDAGLNLGGWRLRNQAGYQWVRGGPAQFQRIRTYAEHDVDRLQAQLTIGDSFTTGQLFDGNAFRGAQVASDERMLPDSLRSYAPIVKGTAETNATVEVSQGGYTLYRTTVAPGDFQIKDLNAVGYGGDLTVTITEADGRVRSYAVPYAAVPQLLRPGTSRFSATVGQLRDESLVDKKPVFAEATYQRGLSNYITVYGGVQATTGSLYRSALAGAALSTPIGALAADVAGSRAAFSSDGGTQQGYSARVTYSKAIPSTSTNFTLAAYRYSSDGYLNLADATRLDDAIRIGRREGEVPKGAGRQRSRFDLTLSQNLGQRGGSMFVSGSRHDFWDIGRPVDTSYQVGWSNRYRNLTYSLSASRSRSVDGRSDINYYAALTVPLGSSTRTSRAPLFGLQATRGDYGNSVQSSVTGSGGRDNKFHYGVNGKFTDDNTDSVGAYAAWHTPYSILGSSYTYGTGYKQITVNAAGGLVVHPGGVTLAQSLGDTIGVVEAKGAKGARLDDGTGRIDARGYAVASSLTPYRMNDVSLDARGMSNNVELQDARVEVAPRAGAVVPIKFETTEGLAFLIRATREDGHPVPFGAEVTGINGQILGRVGQGGHVLVRLPDASAHKLLVHWEGEGCSLSWDMGTAPSSADRLKVITGMCRPL